MLVLTAKRDREQRIQGLELGADDYLTKPFSPRELVLRAKAILRRVQESGTTSSGRVLRAGPIRLDAAANEISVDGDEIVLTPTEFRLLAVLMEREGRTQSRKQLLEKAWNLEPVVAESISTRTVDMHVKRLRVKLGDLGDWIETIRGFGYRFRALKGAE